MGSSPGCKIVRVYDCHGSLLPSFSPLRSVPSRHRRCDGERAGEGDVTMLAIRRPTYRGKHGVWVYREHAVKHVAQVVVLVIPATIALWTHMLLLPALAVLMGEALLVGLLPRSPQFRRHVDAR